MTTLLDLQSEIETRAGQYILSSILALNELTVEVAPQHLISLALLLRDDPQFDFKMLVDLCGIDYLHYGLAEWETESATETGFCRGVLSTKSLPAGHLKSNRFAVVYHLLSLQHNWRLRLRVMIPDKQSLIVDSVTSIWPSAEWYEREAFDLFGILFKGHADLRRLLTDYGFIGHPFRKDFPLIGNVEVRYDAALKSVVYEPVSIEARILEPKVIRKDNRYLVDRIPDGN